MNAAPDPEVLTSLVEELAEQGWSRRADLVPSPMVVALEEEARAAFAQGVFRRGRVGRGAEAELRPEVRTDRVLWVHPESATPVQTAYLTLMEALRLTLNRELQLGLFEFEGHLAIYPPGSFYRRHLDQTRGTPLRTVTCITYLNRDWHPDDGGALRMYLDESDDRYLDLYPEGGTTLLFLADRFEHEVRPAQRDRASLSGWFRRRPA